MTSAMADFGTKSAIFRARVLRWAARQARRWGRIAGQMADLLMNSAIPSEGSMQTS